MALKASFSFISADLSKSFTLGHGRKLLSIAAIPSVGGRAALWLPFYRAWKLRHRPLINFPWVLSEHRSSLLFFLSFFFS